MSLLFSETILVNYSQPCSVHSLWIKHRVDSCVAMGEEKGMTQMLKECSLSDKLCSKYTCLCSLRIMKTKVWIESRRGII